MNNKSLRFQTIHSALLDIKIFPVYIIGKYIKGNIDFLNQNTYLA